MTARATPSQTVGPFFADALIASPHATVPAHPDGSGDALVTLEGRVLDATGAGVDDALVELWRPDPDHPDDAGAGYGWGRSATDGDGAFRFTLPRPPEVAHGGEAPAAHVLLLVLARGILDVLFTRAYFVEEDAPPPDPVLDAVPAGRRRTLLAVRDGDLGGRPRYRFDVRLQGPGETVFFEL